MIAGNGFSQPYRGILFLLFSGLTIPCTSPGSYPMYLTRLLNILKNAGLITYRSHSSQNRWFVYNPDFFGSIYHDIRWRSIDLKMMQYLQVKTCSMSEIQRIEKRVHGRFWRRSKIKYSIEKIIRAGIAERKHYNISPYPRGKCYAFLLLVEGSGQDVLKFIVNFGKGGRIYKTYTMCKDKGFVWCWATPQVGPELMKGLDNLRPRIQTRCLQLKSAGHGDTLKKSFNEEHFNFEKQQWEFPFKQYEEETKRILEKRKE
ncbi:MAG: hypothetical protein AYK18_17170 [Theionarchaea archaeon DG-70]|nr:MAG: hypothetical protein AYK18_17170 [Theionarchaea archaeon DG-70]